MSFLRRDPMTLMALATATQLPTGRLTSTLADLRRRQQVVYEGGKWRIAK